MKALLAIVVAMPLYFMIDFGWGWLCIIALQLLAGLND